MNDIFISYARADRDRIEALAAALEADGHSVWWDRHIGAGAEFSTDIEKALHGSKTVIVCWSRDAVKSRWVKDEATVAARAGKLKTISLDGTEPPIGYMQYHALDFSDWRGDRDEAIYQQLTSDIRAHVPQAEAVAQVDAPMGIVSPMSDPPAAGAPKAALWGGILALAAVFAIVMLVALRGGGGDDAGPDAAAPAKLEKLAAPTPAEPPIEIARATRSDAARDNIVAVLPFSNRSADPNDAFFADGVHDDLLTRLSKISALQVISRTSVMRFRDTEDPIPSIAETLGAAVVMEGAVQRAGDRIRINVQLIDGVTDRHLWAEIYDRELTADNIFDIQEEITRAIAGALEAVLSGDDEATLNDRPTKNIAAYNKYLRALAEAPQVYTITQEDIDTAIEALDAAIALDPDFASAHARKGYTQLMAYWLLAAGDSWRDAARESLAQAQALAPNDVETLYTEGYYRYWAEKDYDAADRVFEKLLAQAPNHADALSAKAFTQRRRGNYADTLNLLLQVQDVNPLDISTKMEIADTAGRMGKFEIARAALDQADAIDSRHPGVAAYHYFVARYMGDADGAWQATNRPIDRTDYRPHYWRLGAAILTRSQDNIDTALAVWPESLRTPENLPEIYTIARAEALFEMGDVAQARQLAAQALATINARDVAYPSAWLSNAVIYPTRAASLAGDRAEVARLVTEFEAAAKPDVHGNASIYRDIAIDLARVGDRELALEYLERIIASMSPVRFLEFSVIPAFDVLHDAPRWKAMEAQYAAWRETNQTTE